MVVLQTLIIILSDSVFIDDDSIVIAGGKIRSLTLKRLLLLLCGLGRSIFIAGEIILAEVNHLLLLI